MKIKSLKYQDKSRNWKLETTSFGDLTLLVGASGVGKTQILRSIQNIKRIANGISLSGVCWHIEFQESDCENFVWQGEFENRKEEYKPRTNLFEMRVTTYEPKIVWEKLFANNNLIIERDDQNIYFNEKETVKLPQEKSVVHLLREEGQIYGIEQAFKLIVSIHYLNQPVIFDAESINRSKFGANNYSYPIDSLEKITYGSIEKIRNSNEPLNHQLFWCFQNEPKIFTEIKKHFMNIFPFVKDIKVKAISDAGEGFFDDMYKFKIQILEEGVKDWIDENYISAGMHFTLLQISDLYLCADGTVFLIDEFENSLGINCIDDLTSILLNQGRDLQFILTSHHPYIINNVNYENWKIVTRQGGVVKTHDASEFNLGKSKHEAFTQLMNLDEYAEGIEV